MHPSDALTNDLPPRKSTRSSAPPRRSRSSGWLLPQRGNHRADGRPQEKAFSRGERLFVSHLEQISANVLLSCATGSDRSPSAPRPPSPQATSPQRPCQHQDPSSHGENPLAAEPCVTPAGGFPPGGNKSTAGLPPQPGCPAALPAPLALLPSRGGRCSRGEETPRTAQADRRTAVPLCT